MNVKDQIKDIYHKLKELNLKTISGGIQCSDCDLDDLGDVNAAAPADGEVLTWVAAANEWQAQAGGGGAVSESDIQYLDDFDDSAIHWSWCEDAKNGSITEAGTVVTLAIANGVNGQIGVGGDNKGPRMAIGSPGVPIEIKCKLDSYTVNDYTHAGLFVSTDITSSAGAYWYVFGRSRDSLWGINGLATWANGGYINSNAVTILPIYLRIRISALNLACSCYEAAYSTDDIIYTVLETGIMGSNLFTNYKEGLCIGILARNGMDDVNRNAISAQFDWFYARRSFGAG